MHLTPNQAIASLSMVLTSSKRNTDTTPTVERRLYEPATPKADAVQLGLVYPAPYNIGMSSLGFMALYKILDTNPDVATQRIFSNDYDRADIRNQELLGYSFSFEIDILEILNSYKQMSIPLYASDRSNEPLVFAGGPTVMTNPEPFADFFDFFVIGEGEEVLSELAEAMKACRSINKREDKLHYLAKTVQGVYVPSLFKISYSNSSGEVTAITPLKDDIPNIIEKRRINDLDDFVNASPILTDDTVFGNTFLVEVMRGCAHRCRFCLASYSVLPARGPSISPLIDKIEFGLHHTNKIGLLGALISNHPDFNQLCEFLNTKEGITVSSASLRADTLTPLIAETFKQGGQRQITIAIETGSDRLKRRINKNLKNEDVKRAASVVSQSGLEGLKLYGMVGLPDETEDDVTQLVDLVKEIKKENKQLKLSLTVSSFVPKAFTPFQWQAKADTKTIKHRQELLRKSLVKVADVRPTSPKWDYLQALLSRGDRRLSGFIVKFWELGASLGSTNKALKDLKAEGQWNDMPELDWFALRERNEQEILPWEMLSLGVSKDILYKESLPPPGF